MSDSTTRFSNRADDYARFRPSYPPEVIDAICESFADPVVADLGAGTGISTLLLASAAKRVYAVEPNASMREKIETRPNVTPVNGTAEATTLAEGSVDIVTAFQAYHWFDPPRVLAESERIGRPRVRFAAVWNERDGTDPFMRAYQDVIDPYMKDATEERRRNVTVEADLRASGWSNVRRVDVRHETGADWEQLIGRTRSASYLPREGPDYETMAAKLRDLFDRAPSLGGSRFAMVASVYLGERQ